MLKGHLPDLARAGSGWCIGEVRRVAIAGVGLVPLAGSTVVTFHASVNADTAFIGGLHVEGQRFGACG
jgi:hypothetical protein